MMMPGNQDLSMALTSDLLGPAGLTAPDPPLCDRIITIKNSVS